MRDDPIQSEIDRFDPAASLSSAWTPPASWYTDPRFLEREREVVFRRSWQAVGRVDQVARTGDYFTGELLGDPYVVVRGAEGSIGAFFNVCRHHAAAVCAGEGQAKELTCPYHGWTYSLEGRLLRAPKLGKSDLLEPDRFGLLPVPCEMWGPFIFIYLGSDPPPLRETLSELEPRLSAARFEHLRFSRRVAYDMKCNWKVYVDNYLDGGYHVSQLHRGLAGQLDLKSYRTEIFPRLSIQSCPPPRDARPGPEGDFPERIGAGALYAWIHPNLMINRYGPVMDTNYVQPLSQDRTRVIFDFYFERTEGEEAKEFIERSIAQSHVVQMEDVTISESVQAGLSSRAYDRGIYAPAFEAPMYHFHRLLAADLRRTSHPS
jgi:phenylpropionate dioxygenase-like ring-hydroxylating dioxygenase large terminal subunit